MCYNLSILAKKSILQKHVQLWGELLFKADSSNVENSPHSCWPAEEVAKGRYIAAAEKLLCGDRRYTYSQILELIQIAKKQN